MTRISVNYTLNYRLLNLVVSYEKQANSDIEARTYLTKCSSYCLKTMNKEPRFIVEEII